MVTLQEYFTLHINSVFLVSFKTYIKYPPLMAHLQFLGFINVVSGALIYNKYRDRESFVGGYSNITTQHFMSSLKFHPSSRPRSDISPDDHDYFGWLHNWTCPSRLFWYGTSQQAPVDHFLLRKYDNHVFWDCPGQLLVACQQGLYAISAAPQLVSAGGLKHRRRVGHTSN